MVSSGESFMEDRFLPGGYHGEALSGEVVGGGTRAIAVDGVGGKGSGQKVGACPYPSIGRSSGWRFRQAGSRDRRRLGVRPSNHFTHPATVCRRRNRGCLEPQTNHAALPAAPRRQSGSALGGPRLWNTARGPRTLDSAFVG